MEKKNALISVFNKDGIVEFSQALIELGWRIISSGGTAKVLAAAGVPVTDVAEISGLPAILDHRVVTLVPQIHGGLLATEDQMAELESLGYPWIDLVCVDLYPLQAEIAREGATRESVIKKTDIGGPTMIRSGAKGRRLVIVDPADRVVVANHLIAGEPNSEEFRNNLAAKAEGIVANYCLASARYHSGGKIDGLIGTQVAACKYGENAWQQPAGLFSVGGSDPLGLDKFELLEGSLPSYNNWCDIDRMLQTMTHIVAGFDNRPGGEDNGTYLPAVAIGAKHGNACGVGFGMSSTCVEDMLSGDPLAIFGGLVMTNFCIHEDQARSLLYSGVPEGQRRLFDGIIAPNFTGGAVDVLARKAGKCRLLKNPALADLSINSLDSADRFRYVRGGFLRQPNYTNVVNLKALQASATRYSESQVVQARWRDLVLAWAIGSTSNSNTITLVNKSRLISNGVGQQDRVGVAKLAVERAKRSGHDTRGSIAYSDSFFPFTDGVEVLADAGVEVILASSGSVNDGKVRDFCDSRGISLILLPDAEARGFFGH
jgi:phosphoribosylaminoimidazolecarboxamide formyltransferase/IMP cyclohydrolase